MSEATVKSHLSQVFTKLDVDSRSRAIARARDTDLFYSEFTKLFAWFFWLYNVGVVLTSAMLIWHGSLTVLGLEPSKMIAGIAGLGHMLITAGMIVFFVALRRSVAGRPGDLGVGGAPAQTAALAAR